MDFELSDEQRGLVDATRSLLNSKARLSSTRRLINGHDGYDANVWRLGADLGWTALALPEKDGGLGQGLIDLTLVAVEHGRFLASTPFIPTVIAADAVVRSDLTDKAKILPMLTAGTATASWAFDEFGQQRVVSAFQNRAQKSADGYVINGMKTNVQDANSARWLLVDVTLDGQPARFVVPADSAGVRILPQRCLDVTRTYCDISFDDVYVDAPALCSVASTASAEIARSAALAGVLTCAELVGIGEQLLDMTLDYVSKRKQFGRPVGSYQAVKHKCANMRIWVQASAAATYYAAMAVDANAADHARAVSVAKAYVSEAITRLSGEALQLHGGIGFTWEHDLHLYLRRSHTLSLLYGTATHHRELLCAALESTDHQLALNR